MSHLILTPTMMDQMRSNKCIGWLYMNPVTFLMLTIDAGQSLDTWLEDEREHTRTLEEYNEFARNGKSILMPWLDVDIKTGRVLGHEGRHRAAACIHATVREFPVAIRLYEDRYPIYYREDTSGHTWVKTYLGKDDCPDQFKGQYNSYTSRPLPDSAWQREFWTDRNVVHAIVASMGPDLSLPTLVGIGWDQYDPKLEATVMRDMMVLQGINRRSKLTVLVDPNALDTERDTMVRLLKRIGVAVAVTPGDCQVFKQYLRTDESRYDLPREARNAKVFRKILNPRYKRQALRPNDTRYPEFPVREYPAPPGTTPSTMVMPSYNPGSPNMLPYWAQNG